MRINSSCKETHPIEPNRSQSESGNTLCYGDTVSIVLAPKAVQKLTTQQDQLRKETNRLRAKGG